MSLWGQGPGPEVTVDEQGEGSACPHGVEHLRTLALTETAPLCVREWTGYRTPATQFLNL